MRLMKAVQDQTATHTCPKCNGAAYCAMEDGFSANLCWCMTLPPVGELAEGDCLCRSCLMESVKKGK